MKKYIEFTIKTIIVAIIFSISIFATDTNCTCIRIFDELPTPVLGGKCVFATDSCEYNSNGLVWEKVITE